MIEEGFTLIFQSPDSHIKKNINFAHLFRGDRLSDGVMAAQEILVLLEIVRFSLELLQFFHLCASAGESSSALFIIHFFKCFFYLNNLFFFSTACDKSLSFALKACR